MTAFDNIKTNNWPSSTTDPFEDFCVLKLPLNNLASLTESLPVVAGSKALFPKRTLTNSGAFAESDIGAKWDASTTGSPYNGSWDVVFDGNATANSNTQGPSYWHYTYESTTSVTLRESISGQIEILAGRPGSNDSGTHSITLQSGGSDVHTVTLGTNGASGYQWFDFGTRSNIDKFVITGGDPGVAIWAVRVDNVLLVNPTGGPKKFYDNNATFNAQVLTTTAPVPRAGAPRTLEFWAYLNSGASSWQNIISYGSSGAGQCFGINRGNSDTSNIAFTGYSSGDWDTGTSVASYLDTWTHFSVSYDSGTVEIFLNGTSIGTASRTLNTGGSTFVVGGSEHSGNNERVSGMIQDVRVYNKKIRTANFTPPGAILG